MPKPYSKTVGFIVAGFGTTKSMEKEFVCSLLDNKIPFTARFARVRTKTEVIEQDHFEYLVSNEHEEMVYALIQDAGIQYYQTNGSKR